MSCPSSKIRISLGWVCTSTARRRVPSGPECWLPRAHCPWTRGGQRLARDHAVLGDPPLDRQHARVRGSRAAGSAPVSPRRSARRRCAPLWRGVAGWRSRSARCRTASPPDVGLRIEIVEVEETPREEDVLAHIAVGSLDLACRLRPGGLAGPRRGAAMAETRHERSVAGDHAVAALADHRVRRAIRPLDGSPYPPHSSGRRGARSWRPQARRRQRCDSAARSAGPRRNRPQSQRE